MTLPVNNENLQMSSDMFDGLFEESAFQINVDYRWDISLTTYSNFINVSCTPSSKTFAPCSKANSRTSALNNYVVLSSRFSLNPEKKLDVAILPTFSLAAPVISCILTVIPSRTTRELLLSVYAIFHLPVCTSHWFPLPDVWVPFCSFSPSQSRLS